MEGIMRIGSKIKKLRLERNLSQSDLAGEVFSRNYISQIEREVIQPSKKAIKHIASKLNVPEYMLVDENSNIDGEMIEKIHNAFLSARRVYMSGDYKKCIEMMPIIIKNGTLLNSIDFLQVKVWYVDSYSQILDWDNALKYTQEFLNEDKVYSRSELKLILELKRFEGTVYYNKGMFEKALHSHLAIEEEIEDKELDIDIAFRIDNLSIIQVLYEFIGAGEEVKEYYKKVMEHSKKHKIITQGLLRSISRYYRDYADLNLEEIKVFYNSVIYTAKLVEDWVRVAIVYSCLIEICFRDNELALVDQYLKSLNETIPRLEGNYYPGFYIAYHHLYRGKYHVKLSEYDEAKIHFNKAVEFLEENKRVTTIKLKIDSLLEIASLYMKLEEYSSSLLYLDMAEAVSLEYSLYTKLKNIDDLKTKAYSQLKTKVNKTESILD